MSKKSATRINAPPTRVRGRPFKKGNPGRAKGSRNKVTMLAEHLLDGEAPAIMRKAIELAKRGNPVALRLCLERLVPVRKDRTVNVDLPPIESPESAAKAAAAVTQAVATGKLTPNEGAEMSKVIDTHVRATGLVVTLDEGDRPMRIIFEPGDELI